MGFIDDDSLNMSGYGIGEIYVGMKKSVSKTITESDVYTYAGIIGDINPVHVNAEYAKTTRFGERIAHGMLTASFFSTIVGMPQMKHYCHSNRKYSIKLKCIFSNH